MNIPHQLSLPNIICFFDLNGSFIEGFYSEDRIKNGVSNVFYSDGRLYIFHSFVNCLYFIDEDAIISCFYVPTEYELAMYRYDESIDGYNLVVNRTDTSGSVVLTDEKGHQTTVFSDLYDNSGNKKSEIVFFIWLSFAFTVNILVGRNIVKNRRTSEKNCK